ncbi:MAG: MgtC/SapB family protein [Pseudomonadota bacterium]
MLSLEMLASYWVGPELTTNLIIILNLSGALLLGLLVGYERSYHGRAAGMRTYGLVCMASASLTVISGYPEFWFGGHFGGGGTDPTRVVQGIVTGIGFLGAGVIMKEGFSISGLTTAASLWAASVIGIMIGIGFYVAGIVLAALVAICMVWISMLENWLPSRHAVAVSIKFKKDFVPHMETINGFVMTHGYQLASGSVRVTYDAGQLEWHFVVVALRTRIREPLTVLATNMAEFDGVDRFDLSHARN